MKRRCRMSFGMQLIAPPSDTEDRDICPWGRKSGSSNANGKVTGIGFAINPNVNNTITQKRKFSRFFPRTLSSCAQRKQAGSVSGKKKELSTSLRSAIQGAHLTFCATCVSPSPPQTCGGEGRGEEAFFGNPSPCPSPRLRGARGFKSAPLPKLRQKVGCAPIQATH